MTDQDWNERAKRYVKGELKRAGVTYDELSHRLGGMGMPETRASISNKVSRGAFTAAFFLAAMKAINKEAVRLEDV